MSLTCPLRYLYVRVCIYIHIFIPCCHCLLFISEDEQFIYDSSQNLLHILFIPCHPQSIYYLRENYLFVPFSSSSLFYKLCLISLYMGSNLSKSNILRQEIPCLGSGLPLFIVTSLMLLLSVKIVKMLSGLFIPILNFFRSLNFQLQLVSFSP